MPSVKIIQVISALSKISSFTSFTIFPFVFSANEQIFVEFKIKTLQQKRLMSVLFIGYITIAIQFILNTLYREEGIIIPTIFHGVVLAMITAGISYLVGYNNSANEFCCVLNAMARRPNGITDNTLVRSSDGCRRDTLLFVFILSAQIAMTILYLVFIPVVDITLTLTNKDHVFFLLCKFSKYSDILYILIILVKMPLLYMLSLMALISIGIWVLVVVELRDKLKILKSLVFCKSSQKDLFNLVNTYYCQLQLFTMLANKCFQLHFWPPLEFVGSSVSISLFFTLVKYHKLLNIYVQVGLVVALIIVVSFIWIVFDVASQSLLISAKILKSSKLN